MVAHGIGCLAICLIIKVPGMSDYKSIVQYMHKKKFCNVLYVNYI